MEANGKIVSPSSNELVIGIVRAIGTDESKIIKEISYLLSNECGYQVENVKLSALLTEVPGVGPFPVSQNKYEFYRSHMDAGDSARKLSTDYLALLGISGIAELRDSRCSDTSEDGGHRVAWIIDSLMHTTEVATFRAVYGQQFLLIGIYEEEGERRNTLRGKLSSSAQMMGLNLEEIVEELMRRDRGIDGSEFSLNIEKTFYLSDAFVDVADPVSNRQVPESIVTDSGGVRLASNTPTTGLTNWTLRSLFELIFGALYLTPTRHELAMAHATIAAISSGSLARRVGAAIVTEEGEIVATGCNDVPAVGGGLYPVFDAGTKALLDARDHVFRPDLPTAKDADDGYGYDANDMVKFEIFDDLLFRMKKLELVEQDADAWTLLGQSKDLRKAQLFDVLEYGRTVHAEMAAIISAAHRGFSPKGLEIYVTTFPCHECARHIIAAGITKVIYLEPYPKSRVAALHYDAVVLKKEAALSSMEARSRTQFLPFIGIAPSRLISMHSWLERKSDFGQNGFPPGRATEKAKASALSKSSRPRWSTLDTYYDDFAPARIKLSEEGVSHYLQDLGRG